MPDLSFRVEGVEAERFSATPLLNFRLRLECDEPVHGVMLRCQIRIDPARRRYEPAEQQRLRDLFGEPERWGQTLHSMLWTNTSAVAPPFEEAVEIDLPAPCTFDFNVATAKYFQALDGGCVPLTLLFSGTIFYANSEGALQVAQIPWSKELAYAMPVRVWKEMMDAHYPNTAWVCLRRDVFERLHQYKIERGLPTWEQAMENLLP